MTEPNKKNGVIAWAERTALILLLGLTVSNLSSLAEVRTKQAVMMEVMRHQITISEGRATHEARLVAIENTRQTADKTRQERDEDRAHFDAQLLDLWRELQVVKASIPEANAKLRERLEAVMERLEARIRACEQKE